MNFVPCLAWVPRGVAKATPQKVKLLSEQLKELIEKGAPDSNVDGMGDMDDGKVEEPDDDITAKYGLDTYDDEEDTAAQVGSLAGLAVFANNADDPYLDPEDDEDSEDEIDNFTIRPTDNLIAVARVDEDTCATVEVYVSNHQEKHLYVHHDIALPAYPLCLEWMNFDPTDPNTGNYLAVGDMTPVISVWDLDLVDSLEPAYKLGKKAKKKKASAKTKMMHTDAVLSLSWNKQMRHLLASGSADHKALVWDLDTGEPARCLSAHREKVQSISWHPFESHTLLTGACDGTAKLWDCRGTDASFKSWAVDGEVEKVLWNHFDPFYFYVSTEKGNVYAFDARKDEAVFTLSAHTKAVTGLALSAYCPGCLITASEDKSLKVWDVLDHKPVFLFSQEPLAVGSVLAMASSPDEPFVVALGGDDKSLGFSVLDLTEWTALSHFEGRKLLKPDVQADEAKMDTDIPSGALGSLSLDS